MPREDEFTKDDKKGSERMKKIIVYFFLALNIGCTLKKETVITSYRPTQSSQKYYLDLPKGFSLKGFSISTENENHYIYDDSSFIYITKFKNTPNYYNIKKMGDSILNFRFQNEELVSEINQLTNQTIINPLPDTLELSGKQENGLYWKDLKVGEISVGYVNVKPEEVFLFDKTISTLRKRKKQKSGGYL
ncbi:MAG: hypothetical protein CVT94_13970 [Bacteroidetes bacterium HGW-Bacteroidetes-11]|nr:MAG: hypothetical protein CVT94_13970 [Bacteroidetes bacterium HGW-Bacteroidetes-11]